MKFDVLLTGVGGEGVLTTSVILARAANLEGYFVRGVQLHGLAQRGGSIPTVVRFGDEREISSPGLMQADADLVLAFEPLEAVRAIFYARKDKTDFLIDDYKIVPIYANVLKVPYPEIEEMIKQIRRFARSVRLIQARKLAREKFGDMVFGNVILLGAAIGERLLPLKRKSMIAAIKITAPRELEKNLAAFKLGLNMFS